jgi:hypothetical protein
MFTRRQFLKTATHTAASTTITFALAPLLLQGCGGDDDNTSSGGTPAPATTTNPTQPTPTTATCDGAGATSTVVADHTHMVCVPLADINAAPGAGTTYTTTPAATDGHTHDVVLTQAELRSLAAGQTIDVTTTITESHTHDFALVETQPTATPAPTPSPTPVY